jgi:hypothetical protein
VVDPPLYVINADVQSLAPQKKITKLIIYLKVQCKTIDAHQEDAGENYVILCL